jgi:hypothetical protein
MLVPGDDRGSVDSKAVGKPDKMRLFDLGRKHFWGPGTTLRPLQPCLQTALLRRNCPSIANLLPDTLFRRKWKCCTSKQLVACGSDSDSDGAAI